MWNIVFLGLVSFFADFSTEMVYPIIPLYLTAAFGATPSLIGVIEGIAESIAGLLKVFSGYITDRYGKKKLVAFFGYATGLIYKVALIFAGSWAGILFARVTDRLGKGIRTAPRDVMVSENTDSSNMGKAYGLHKSLDMLGSAAGILAAYWLLSRDGMEYKQIFLWSMIPAVLALCMFFFIKEKKHDAPPKERTYFWKNIKSLDPQLRLYIFVSFLFTLGNSSNAFLLLRAKSVGFTDTNVILLYFVYNIVASILAVPLGRRSDKIGRKRLLVAGYITFAVVYAGFAFATTSWMMIAVFVLYGVYTAVTAGAERAYIAEIAPEDLRGTMLGLQSTVVGVTLLPASAIAGLLWDNVAPEATFIFGAALSFAAAMILLFFMKNPKAKGQTVPEKA